MLESVTRPLLQRFVEWRIRAALSVAHDPEKTRLKQWLAVAHADDFLEEKEIWQYQFAANPALTNQPQPSLLDVMLDQSDQLLQRGRQFKWYERIWRRLVYGKYYVSRYRNQSQHYYKEAFEIWKINKQLSASGHAVTYEPPPLKWYHRFLIKRIKKLGLKWEFGSQDFSDQETFFKKLSLHEATQVKNKGVIAEKVAVDAPTIDPVSESKESESSLPFWVNQRVMREPYTADQLLSGSPWMRELILSRMVDKRKTPPHSETHPHTEEDAAQTITPQAQLSDAAIPPHLASWLTGLSLTQSVDQTYQQQQTVSQEQQVDFDYRVDLKRVQTTQRWTDDSAQLTCYEVKLCLYNRDEPRDVDLYHQTHEWLQALDSACERKFIRENKLDTLKNHSNFLKITENAKNALLMAR